MEGRILAIDPGGRRIGLALTDPLRIIASPYKTLWVRDEEDALKQLLEVIVDQEVVEIVIGLPINTQRQDSTQTKRVRAFTKRLQSMVDVPIALIDESFSSVEAERMLHNMGKKVGDDKGAVDRLAATVILEQYLAEIRH
ncbi:MAG: Holliday junction resolvase RuvX [Candidatus Marinimicrobia bacterium]|nr:Holliday junction resolvase RuvX [Candidatus Neomarinimicrobiota bacterium]MCF7839166.1 Holliday junction resolvase RuvX [Candidatus Neomarinimicrobiota bacterium]